MTCSFQLIAEEIQLKVTSDMIIEFSGPKVLLELPKGNNGTEWMLVPHAKPPEASDSNAVLVHEL